MLQIIGNKNWSGMKKLAVFKAVSKKQSDLPEGYTKLDYLLNTQGAYIDTGMVLDRRCKITIAFEADERDDNRALFGWRRSGNFNQPYQFYINTNKPQEHLDRLIIIGVGANVSFVGSKECFELNVKNTLVVCPADGIVTLNGSNVTFNYELAIRYAYNASGSSEIAPALFAFNNAGTIGGISNGMKLYRYKVEKDGELLQDFIPCISPEDIYGVYDLVSETFIGSSNENSFTGGND